MFTKQITSEEILLDPAGYAKKRVENLQSALNNENCRGKCGAVPSWSAWLFCCIPCIPYTVLCSTNEYT